MRPEPRLLVACLLVPFVAACPGAPVEGGEGSSSGGAESSTTEDAPTGGMTGIMTTDNTTGTTAPETTDASSSSTEPDPTTETSESTGDAPGVVVEGLMQPESIVVDVVDGVYLISNINGVDPGADDGNGFISRVGPDGTMLDLMWIAGGGDVNLSAPKGMAIHEDTLYVADIDRVHRFDRVSGAHLGAVAIDGAMFLNDVVADPFGIVYVSDTATNKIHRIDGDTAVEFLASSDINGTNGLLYKNMTLYAVGYNAGEMFEIPVEAGVASPIHTFAAGGLDGIAEVADGFLVSSWDAQAVYKLSADFSASEPLVEGVQSPADIAVDPATNQLLIPQLELGRALFVAL
ncbi:MAG: hypothetical protein JNL82_24520 [Myxococcales bacterium]|nr:hypothetical protein [Myxococcales bacterium]